MNTLKGDPVQRGEAGQTGFTGLTGCSFFSPFPEEREKENPLPAEGSYGRAK
ncbi:MAG: hypothetical protein R6T98_07065 [Desulfatiglandales bacterium]